MQSTSLNTTIILIPIIFTIVFVLLIIIYTWRYRKFPTNVYVIWLRNGLVRKVLLGGAGFLYPVIDQIVIIPKYEQLFYSEYDECRIEVHFNVIDAKLAFESYNWYQNSDEFIKNILSSKVKSLIKQNFTQFKVEVDANYNDVVKKLKKALIEIVIDKGISIQELMIEKI